jgi:hypothetical protein
VASVEWAIGCWPVLRDAAEREAVRVSVEWNMMLLCWLLVVIRDDRVEMWDTDDTDRSVDWRLRRHSHRYHCTSNSSADRLFYIYSRKQSSIAHPKTTSQHSSKLPKLSSQLSNVSLSFDEHIASSVHVA